MAGLAEVVLELQEQNRALDDVKEGIKAMLVESIADRKRYEREAGKREEERREATSQREKSRTAMAAPKSFGQGLAQGTGLAGMSNLLGDMIKGIGLGGSFLGGATLGGLFGRAVGRLFFPALGAFFGTQYLDKWVDPLVDKITGDDATWQMFGNQFDASKIVSGFAGALAVIFGKDALIQTAKGLLGVGDDTKTGAMRKSFVRRLGLGAALYAMSGVLGDAIKDLTGSQTAGDITSTMVNGMSIAMMFMPGGLLIRSLAGFAIGGGMLIAEYWKKKNDEQRAAFEAEVAKVANQEKLNEQSDAMLIAKAQKMAEDVGAAQATGAPTVEPAVQEAYLRELEKRAPREAELAFLKEEIAYQLAELKRLRSMNSPAAVDIIGPLSDVLQQYKYATGVDHPAATELKTIREDMINPTVNIPSPVIPFDRFAKAYDQYAASRIAGETIKRDPYSYFGPSDAMRSEAQLMAQPIPGGNYMKAEQLIENFKASGGFPTININNIDNSTGDTTVAKGGDNVSVQREMVDIYDRHYSRQYMGIPGHGMYGFR